MASFRMYSDPFEIISGAQPISVGAPHHGTLRNVDADLGTGPIAAALARRLGGRGVIVSNLRRRVDVNKNPAEIKNNLRHYALSYQDELFRGLPKLVVEIHGHVTGNYPIEISSGFSLDPSFPPDAKYMRALTTLKQSLPSSLAGKFGQTFVVGIFPLDRDLVKTATNTYTFQKIRRARNRAGIEWYGLHIELPAELRVGARTGETGFLDALADGLANAIESAFLPWALNAGEISVRAEREEDVEILARLRVVKAMKDSVNDQLAALSPSDFGTLGFLEGDSLLLYNAGEHLRSTVTASTDVRPATIALPARIRNQLELQPGDTVSVSSARKSNPVSARSSPPAFVVEQKKPGSNAQVWISPADGKRLESALVSGCLVNGADPTPTPFPARLTLDPDLRERHVLVSDDLAEKLSLTFGDLLMIEAVS